MAQTARRTLQDAVDNAMKCYDQKDQFNAVYGFIADLRLHQDTNHLADPIGLDTKLRERYVQGRSDFRQYIQGFTVDTAS